MLGREKESSYTPTSLVEAHQSCPVAVGERVKVNLHTGRIEYATIKAVIERTDGKRLQVDFGKDETALVHLWQIVERIR